MSIKRRVAFHLRNTKFFYFFEKLNLIIFHWNERRKCVHFGKEDADKTYYVIRPRSSYEGLLSSYYFVVSNVKWAIEKGYIPYVDFSTDQCQYHVSYKVNDTDNAWEYYFKQPCSISKKDILEKRNVIYSGWTMLKKNEVPSLSKKLADIKNPEISDLFSLYGSVQPYIIEKSNILWNNVLYGYKTLGVFLRGTDYVALKPSGHYIQPKMDDVINKIDEFLVKYNIDKIFLVTEDYNYFELLEGKYKNKIVSIEENYVKDYKVNDYVSESMNNIDAYERGLNYLIKLIMLNKTDYLISGITNGSLFARTIKQGDFEDEYWFELGLYP